MDPGVFVVLRLISDRYYFMESVTNIYDFNTGEGFPRKYFEYDTQEKKFFNYITYNDDYSYKKEIYMVTFPPINSKGELCSTMLNIFRIPLQIYHNSLNFASGFGQNLSEIY